MPGTRESTPAPTRFHTDTTGIAGLLKARQLGVPPHQRSYSWESEQVEDFWNDLLNALETGQAEYFLGSIVTTLPGETPRHTIIDGQQRLATTTILISAIRNTLRRGDSETAGLVESGYLASTDLATLAATPRLTLNVEDAPFFKQLVIDRPTQERPEELHPSHARLRTAADLLAERIEEFAAQRESNWRDALVAWVNYLSGNATVITVDVADESDAFLIFETLNYRGVPLTVADLLKNYLFGLAGEDFGAVQRSWTAATSTLEGFGDPDLFVTFLRHYWISLHGHVRERDLFRAIRTKLRRSEDVVQFASKLESSARSYAALLTPDHEAWGDLGVEARADVESLLRLRIEQNRPLLLAAMKAFEPSELKKLLRCLVSWSVRGLVVGGIGAGKTESYYASAATAVTSGEVTTTDELFERLQEIIPSDERFKAQYASFRPPTNKIARYHLLALERGHRGESEPELVPNEDEEQVNLEHVLPRSPREGEWQAFRRDELADWWGRLGNLVLLRKSENVRLGNREFNEKREALAASDLEVTKTVAEHKEWTQESIVDRQNQLSELAVAVWPRRP